MGFLCYVNIYLSFLPPSPTQIPPVGTPLPSEGEKKEEMDKVFPDNFACPLVLGQFCSFHWIIKIWSFTYLHLFKYLWIYVIEVYWLGIPVSYCFTIEILVYKIIYFIKSYYKPFILLIIWWKICRISLKSQFCLFLFFFLNICL